MFAPIFKDKEEKFDLNHSGNKEKKTFFSEKTNLKKKIENSCLFDTSEIYEGEADLKMNNLVDVKKMSYFPTLNETHETENLNNANSQEIKPQQSKSKNLRSKKFF